MLYEHRNVISYQPQTIPAGQEAVLTFSGSGIPNPENCRYRLRLTGNAGVHPGWMWEGGYPLLYRDIDDSLCTDTVRQAQFSLRFQMNGENYPRRAYCKLPCPLALSPQFQVPGGGIGRWTFSIWVKADQLSWENPGNVGVSFQIWNRRDGLMPHDINRDPDICRILSFSQGTYDWRPYTLPLDVTEETAVILVTVFGEHAKGTVWMELPELTNKDGCQLLPQFTLSNQYHPYLNWLGENLSHKEWTSMRVNVNGRELPEEQLFQRCHIGSENEISLPDGCITAGVNQIVLRNTNQYLCPHPYQLMKAELLWEEIRPMRVLAAPRVVREGKVFALLVETSDPQEQIHVRSDPNAPLLEVRRCMGMQILRFRAGKAGPGFSIVLTAGRIEETVWVERISVHGEDAVLTGTSDAIYISQEDLPLMREFMVWYLHNQIGNFITFRPVYRWTGARELNPACWVELRGMCEAMELPYCHIIDGRELPGLNANPPLSLLEGPLFIGCQGHERDGAYFYWQQRSTEEPYLFFQELMLRNRRHPDYRYQTPIVYTGHGTFLYFDPIAPRDMKECAEQFVAKSAQSLAGIKRHTGPSVLFRYFFQAGLEVGGAELMYGPQEVILAALRGASRAYRRREMAAHMAVQWSTTPHDTPERYRRYQLALFIAWMQGVHHINTEEGAYHMEEYFSRYDRFDTACLEHLRVQRDFAHFVETHTRRGQFQPSAAILHGRYDGWSCFGRRTAWGHLGEEWKFAEPEESWDLIRVFYPDSVLNAIYRHPCPNQPVGFYSRTPYGNVDILPVEASEEILQAYPFLAFLGYHGAVQEDAEKLAAYVKNGGTLLLAWAHLNTQLRRKELLFEEPVLLQAGELTGVMPERFVKEDGCRIGVLPESGEIEVLERTEGGLPLVFRRRLGKGQVLLVNTAEYPAHPVICGVYEAYLRDLAEQAAARQRSRGWLSGTETVQTAVYDQENGTRNIYAVHTGWWLEDSVPVSAKLELGGQTAEVQIPRGVIACVTIADGCAAMVSDAETEILEMSYTPTALSIRAQGNGNAEIRLLLPEGVRPETGVQEKNGMWQLQVKLCGISEIAVPCQPAGAGTGS